MDEDLPERDSAKVEALANAIRELATDLQTVTGPKWVRRQAPDLQGGEGVNPWG